MDSYFTSMYIFDEDANKQVAFPFPFPLPFFAGSLFNLIPNNCGTGSGKGERRGNFTTKEKKITRVKKRSLKGRGKSL